jgi:pseudaminic acid synthase
MTIRGALTINDENSLWKGQELFDLYKKAYTPWEWHEAIFNRAKEHGILAFSSPFDASAVDFLEELDVPVYKIASFENTDHPLLAKVAQTGKPVIMSTGVSNISDIDESVRVLRENGCKELILLKCTSTYPADPANSNILTIPHLKQLFDGIQVGISDHTMGIGVPIAAVALGATVIEKHFTLSRADGGVDSAFSLEPAELKSLCIESERAALSLGKVTYGIQKAENNSKKFKRSIYVVKTVKKGESLTADNIRIIRPGFGMEPKHYGKVIGRQANETILAGTPLEWKAI